jgi:nucleotide-binding universal stress UspA family protein
MNPPLRTVLIGSSLSAESDAVLAAGAICARAAGAAVHVAHAYSPTLIYTLGPPVLDGAQAEWLESERKLLACELAAQLERTGLGRDGARPHLRAGAAHRVLSDLAEEIAPDLIVVGTHEKRLRMRGPALGSTADRVLRKAHCPVLAVHPGAVWPPQRVLVPIDLSPASQAAMTTGLHLLARAGWTPRETEILFVLNPYERQGSIQFSAEQVDRFAAQELDRLVARSLPQPAGIVRTRVRAGYPAPEILAEAARTGADLLVLGTHGRSGFERLLIGSVAAEVLHEAPASVLVVPPEIAAEELVEGTERARTGADWTHVEDAVATPA